jgi:histidine decarboxylase
MKNKVLVSPFPLPAVVNGAISPFDQYCMGYMNPGNSGYGYISTMKLSVDMVSITGLDAGTEGIVSYDRCEKDDAYIGQINMLTASSFCGVNGALWGYHLGVADSIANGSLQPMYYENQNGQRIPVYPVYPLLDAAQRLFGVDAQRRFPPMPGAHVICANKNFTGNGPIWVWASIAIAIANNRDTDANLFIEDAGSFPYTWSELMVLQGLQATQRNVTKSIILCGQDQNVLYKEIFVGCKYLYIPDGYVGCSLTCAPYVSLARDAIPANYIPSGLLGMKISQWEKLLGLPPLPPARKTGEKRLIVKGNQSRRKPSTSRKPTRKNGKQPAAIPEPTPEA